MEPDLIWRCQDGKAAVNRSAHSAPHAFVPEARPPLESLRALINETRLDVPPSLPPMAGGLVGYLGYDMVRQMETAAGQECRRHRRAGRADDAAVAVRDF